MALEAGTRLGKYEVERLLGAGGMGEVYLARDAQLGRPVALKVLPREVAADAARMRRFTQEARAASSLDHQNIIVIHDIGEEAGAHFIASEYVRGETLRERMARGNLPLEEVLSVGMQAASALAAAHEAGVVHRDVKPENLMLRPDGFVKVLDFGLAKLSERRNGEAPDAEAPTRALVHTAPGMVMGTVSYMSPEQAAGLSDVDARTDVWSLGVLLYEMLAGRVPFWFEGATPTQVLSLIIQKEAPPLKHLAPYVPDELNRIVMKALENGRDDRYQSAKEMLVDLRRLRRQLEREAEIERSVTPEAGAGPGGAAAAGAQTRTAGTRSGGTQTGVSTAEVAPAHTVASAEVLTGETRRRRKGVAVVAAALGLAAVAAAFGLYKLLAKKPAPFQSLKIEKLTNIGNATTAQISPDGQYVAHAVYEGGKYSLRVWHVSTKSSVEIIAPVEDFLGVSAFSPDSRYIFYNRVPSVTRQLTLYQIAVLGGESKKVLERSGSGVSFSPDGRRFAFVRPGTAENSLVVVNADGTGEQVLARRGGPERFGFEGPAWSPDGSVIAAAVYADGTNMTVAGVSVADGTVRPLTSRTWLNVYRLAWLRDGSGLVFSAAERTTQIWHLSYPGGEVRRITDDTNSYGTSSFSITADSSTIATLQYLVISDIFTAPVEDPARARQITPGVGGRVLALGMSWTPDGRIVYATGPVSQTTDIWIMNADGTGNRRLTSDPGREGFPDVSPDGRHIVFDSTRSGRAGIWRMDLDGGGGLKQLTDGGRDTSPRYSPDGRWVIYNSAATSELRKVPADGGETVRLTERPVLWAGVSPADGRIAGMYRSEDGSPWRLTVFPPEGGAPVRAFDLPRGVLNSDVRWTPDGRSILYLLERARSTSLWSQPLDGGAPKQLADFSPEEVFSFALSRDGKQLAFARGTVIRDVVLITESEK